MYFAAEPGIAAQSLPQVLSLGPWSFFGENRQDGYGSCATASSYGSCLPLIDPRYFIRLCKSLSSHEKKEIARKSTCNQKYAAAAALCGPCV